VNIHAIARVWRSTLALALLWLGLAGAAGAADSPPLILEHLTTADGLPQGTVFVTLQDSQGFVWLGTEDGLVRYDGHELFRYAHSRGARSGLPGNYIQTLVEDAHGDLWVAVKDAGVARWNRASDSFTVYRHDPQDLNSISSDAVHALLVGSDGRIWIGSSDSGIDILEPASGRMTHLRHDPADPRSLGDDRIFSLTPAHGGAVWVGTEAGLDRWQPDSAGFVHLRHEPGKPQSLSGDQVSHLHEDAHGAIWVGTLDGGLNRLDREGRVVEVFRHDPQKPASLANDDVRAVLEDHAGHLWIGTADGLDLLDRATGQFTHYRRDASDAESLRDSFIMSLYEDPSGLVWIGTRAGGVSRWNPRSWELGGHRPDWLGDKLVTAFADGPDNAVWVASRGGGLVLFDEATGRATGIDAITGRRNAIGDARVMSLRQDRHGTLWIGTMAGGVRKLDSHWRLQTIAAKPGEAHSLSADGIMTIYEAADGHMWIGTHGGGANVIDPATGLVRQLPFGSGAGEVSAPNVSAIAEDRNGNVWIGTDGGGLDLARADGAVIKVYRHDPRDPGSLPANTVYALAVDARNRLWAATDGGGLALAEGSPLSPDTIHFRTVSLEEGLASDTVYGLLTDASDHVWLSSDSGLARYDPASGAVKTWHRQHGLQGEEYNYGAYFRLRDGRLAFGGPGGFNIFDPARLSASRQAPRLALTHVEIMGVPVSGATPAWLLGRIAVDYRANIVSLEFGALDFNSPRRNRLAYRMGGLTDRWIDLGNQHRITLTNLDPGEHLLEVRAANADSVWSAPLRLRIHREPAPWRSPWAYTLYALAALALIGYRLRLQKIRFERVVRQREQLEAEVALRTRELVDTNRQLEEAAQAKSNFLDRMSHELRTPMNGVVGMTELLERTGLSGTQARLTQTIRSSARVLLQIVNDLLDLSKINAGKVELEELPLDLRTILEECTGLFAGAVESRNLELVVCPPRGAPGVCGDPLRIRQILMNLVGNAVKFTQRGRIVVTADVQVQSADRAMLRVAVADTGIGMNAATIARIFSPFTQADESTTRRFGGTGLGLAICRELAELMGGSISVESQLNVGSTFVLTLPLKIGATLPLTSAAPAPAPKADTLLKGHVLLVEDEPVNAAVAQGYLEVLGCTSVWVKDGAEAVARAGADGFDLILMDLSMPTMDGFATTRLIRERAGPGPRVPIVALTAHNTTSYRDSCLQAGMDDILSKPCTLVECAEVLRHWLPDAASERAAETILRQTGEPDVPAPHQTPNSSSDDLTQVDDVAVARLRDLRGGGRSDLYSRLVELFETGSAETLSALRTALEAADLASAAALSHKLASSAANVGAVSFGKTTRELEQVCGAGDAARARVLFAHLATAHPALLQELQSLRLRATA